MGTCVISKDIKLNEQSENKIKILIIDDEEVVLDSCRLILKKTDHQVTTVSNGELGLEVVQEMNPDVVFVDLKMPGLSGFEVLNKIRDIDPNIVTIVITGFSTVSSAIEAMKNGAFDFLPKPFSPDEFRLITNRGIERRKLVLETIALKREKEMLREHFAAVVSHELKSPLGAVQQNLFLLETELSGKLNTDQKDRLERMKSKISDLINLIHTWLRVINVDVKKLKENFKEVSVKTIFDKAVENSQLHATKLDIEINVTCDESLPNIIGDEGTLVEAVGNLLGNAIKFSRISSKIDLSAKYLDGFIEINVIDMGVGISPEDLPYIFEDFFTGKAGEKVEKSSGMGLSITRRIIEAHNGSITVASELGKGTIFSIKLPVITT